MITVRRLAMGVLLLGGGWLLFGGVLAFASGGCTGSSQTTLGDVLIATNQHICGDVNTLTGTVTVNGVVDGNIMTGSGKVIVRDLVHGSIKSLSGNVVVAGTGHVTGNIDTPFGSVTLLDQAHVDGNISSFGHVAHGPGTQVDGSMDISSHFDLTPSNSNTFGFPLLAILIWAALGSAAVTLMPEKVALVRSTITIQSIRSLFVGALSIGIAGLSALILAVTIIGIPAAVVIALAVLVAWVLGEIALGLFIGEWVMHMLAPRRRSKVMEVIAGLAILELLENIGFVGGIIWVAAGLIGLGAVLLSRFGTRLYGLNTAPPYARHA